MTTKTTSNTTKEYSGWDYFFNGIYVLFILILSLKFVLFGYYGVYFFDGLIFAGLLSMHINAFNAYTKKTKIWCVLLYGVFMVSFIIGLYRGIPPNSLFGEMIEHKSLILIHDDQGNVVK